jgi:hypothetical protein
VYGAFLFTAVVLALFIERGNTADEFIYWAKEEIPTVIWTPQGLSLENGLKTAVLINPVYGPIAVFDMDRTVVTNAAMGQLFFFVTSKKIVFRKMMGQLDERDVTKLTLPPQQRPPDQVRITGELIENFYQRGKVAFLLVAPAVIFLSSFVVLMLVTLGYAAVGLLFNRMRAHRLCYGAVFNLACFATGISLLLACLGVVCVTFFIPLPPLPAPLSFLISLIYMFAAITFTDTATS